MDKAKESVVRDGGSASAPRVAVWAVGCAVAVAGALSTFNVPMYLSLLLLLAGSVILALAAPGTPAMNWRAWLVFVSGSVLIIGVLNLFGEERIRHWIPHPAGYIPAWFVCFVGFRQLWWLGHRHEVPQSFTV